MLSCGAGRVQKVQNLFPLADTQREQAGSASSCALRFSVMTLPWWSIELLLSRANEAHLQLMISAAFCQLPGSKQVGGGATSFHFSFSWPFFLISGHVCLPAAEPVLYRVFSVIQELQDWNVCRTIALCLLYSSSQPVYALTSTWLEYLLNQSMRRY